MARVLASAAKYLGGDLVPNKKASGPVDRRVGSRIRARRAIVGLSQEKLAKQIGITFQQIQKYENGSNRVGSGRLQEIANALNVPISYFFADGKEQAEFQYYLGINHPDLSMSSLEKQCSQLIRDFKKIVDPHVRCSILTLARYASRGNDEVEPKQEVRN
jgi:transcriptional regulator with XRE-family HTH domain